MSNTQEITILKMGQLSAVVEVTQNSEAATYTASAYFKKTNKFTFAKNVNLAPDELQPWINSIAEAVNSNAPAELVAEYAAETAND